MATWSFDLSFSCFRKLLSHFAHSDYGLCFEKEGVAYNSWHNFEFFVWLFLCSNDPAEYLDQALSSSEWQQVGFPVHRGPNQTACMCMLSSLQCFTMHEFITDDVRGKRCMHAYVYKPWLLFRRLLKMVARVHR